MSFRRTFFVLALMAAKPAIGGAQSILSAAGLGIPVDAVDARSRALGGVGIGLQGPSILPGDPAAAARLLLGTVVMTARPSWVSYGRSDTNESGTFRGTDFPLVGVAYPAFGVGVITISFESVLDQRYHAADGVTVQVADTLLAATDSFTSKGGVSQVRLGFARALNKNVSVGISIGRYGGSLVRSFSRTFGDSIASGSLGQFRDGGYWTYTGTEVTAGASAELGNVAHVAASGTWSSNLVANASSDTKGSSVSYDLPFQLRVGATGVLAPGLALNVGLTRGNWSRTAQGLTEGTSPGSTLSWGGGIELSRATLLGRSAPLRFGYRHADLPFSLTGSKPVETAWTGGLGLVLKQAQSLTHEAVTQASVDLSFERGKRTDGPISESFKRVSLTLRLTGF
jgi:hypothetical protein